MVEWQRVRFAVFAATVLCARTGAAQGQEEHHGHHGHRGTPAATGTASPSPDAAIASSAPLVSPGEVAEDKMHAGDCAGALDLFDRALRLNVSPELRRDRGACHDKLGHPYPAIDDYRAYLDMRPDAPDADAIRARLDALETETGELKPGDKGKEAAISMSIGGESGGASLDAQERKEQLDGQADSSALRRGHGFEVGLAFDAKHYGSSGLAWAEGGELDIRYSLSKVSTILAELTVSHVNGASSDTALSGPGFFGGYEARIALNKRVSDAFLIGATFGYENLSQGAAGFAFNVLEPQGRIGYRHVIGPSLGLEATLDAGEAFVHLTGAPAGVDANTSTSLVGGRVGVVLGF
jgi:hypothetical protein